MWVFGIGALLLLLIIGMGFATMRAFYLDKEGLLLTEKHVVFRGFGVPYMMAVMTEILVILSGLLMFGVTGSNLLLILAFFGPILVVLGFRVWTQWVHNDYELLEAPSKRPKLSATKVRRCLCCCSVWQ